MLQTHRPITDDAGEKSGRLPLDELRVLDLTQVMAGPFCCMMLGDMGADVIKVEPPVKGDQTRSSMGFRMKGEDSPGFLALNRNKRSVALNLKSETGREAFYELVRTADVVVENSRPGVAAKLGIDYETLAAINPRIVYASISGFGQTGPWSQRPGFDLIAQAMSGMMSAMGVPGGPPVKSVVPVGDLGAGLFALYGILCAVIGREATGRGQHVDASLYESIVSLSIWETSEYWATGNLPKPIGSANRMGAPYEAFMARDGRFVIGAPSHHIWVRLAGALGREDLLDEPRYAQNKDRLANREALAAELQSVFAMQTVGHWVDTLLAAGVPAAPINDYAQALDNEHARARGTVQEIAHPTEGSFKALGFPVKLSGTPQRVRHHPPLLGEHTETVMEEIGLGGEMERLRDGGAFR